MRLSQFSIKVYVLFTIIETASQFLRSKLNDSSGLNRFFEYEQTEFLKIYRAFDL